MYINVLTIMPYKLIAYKNEYLNYFTEYNTYLVSCSVLVKWLLGCEDGELLLTGHMVDDHTAIVAHGGKHPGICYAPHSRIHRVLMLLIAMDDLITGRGHMTGGEEESMSSHCPVYKHFQGGYKQRDYVEVSGEGARK